MSQQNGDSPTGTYWEGYSDYQSVSRSICHSIDRAMDSYAGLQRMHDESARLRAEPSAQAGQQILSAALRLLPELKEERDSKEIYDDILIRWLGDDDFDEIEESTGVEIPDKGFIGELKETQLQTECPEWLYQFAIDIRTAGWHLGYLQAGRTEKAPLDDPSEEQARSMFED